MSLFDDMRGRDEDSIGIVNTEEVGACRHVVTMPDRGTIACLHITRCHLAPEHIMDAEPARHSLQVPAPCDIKPLAHGIRPYAYRIAHARHGDVVHTSACRIAGNIWPACKHSRN